ncbi:MAG: hypothetical protein QXZ17_09555 [Nitrososphaerota archaeon]
MFRNAENLNTSELREVTNLYGKFSSSIISFEETQLIYCIVRIMEPEVVVETGVSNGISIIMTLSTMLENNKGHLFLIDLLSVGMHGLYGKEPAWMVVVRNLGRT